MYIVEPSIRAALHLKQVLLDQSAYVTLKADIKEGIFVLATCGDQTQLPQFRVKFVGDLSQVPDRIPWLNKPD